MKMEDDFKDDNIWSDYEKVLIVINRKECKSTIIPDHGHKKDTPGNSCLSQKIVWSSTGYHRFTASRTGLKL